MEGALNKYIDNRKIEIRCVICGEEFEEIYDVEKTVICKSCDFKYYFKNGCISYDYRYILFDNFRLKYLKNAVLNNNGLLAYLYHKEASLSSEDREDVAHFRDFIGSNNHGLEILDIGAGILDLPAYLKFENYEQCNFYGIDPLENAQFQGVKVIGCGEYIPFRDSKFDSIVFGTSLDHLVSIERTLLECNRVLKSNGLIFVWMSDRSVDISFKNLIKIPLRYIKKKMMDINFIINKANKINIPFSYRFGRYVIYYDYNVMYVPKKAIDPFHSFNESPNKVIKLFVNGNFRLIEKIQNNKNEVFLCFKKIE